MMDESSGTFLALFRSTKARKHLHAVLLACGAFRALRHGLL